MHFIEYHYTKIVRYDLINKFQYNNINELPQIKKIIINFGCKDFKIKNFAAILLALKLITTQSGVVTRTKTPNIFIKIQKGQPTGCKVILKKTVMYNFLSKLLIEIFPNFKNLLKFKINKKTSKNFSFVLPKKLLLFNELKEHYNLYNMLSDLDITIITNVKTYKELFFLLKSFQLPFIKNL